MIFLSPFMAFSAGRGDRIGWLAGWRWLARPVILGGRAVDFYRGGTSAAQGQSDNKREKEQNWFPTRLPPAGLSGPGFPDSWR
jgi:hypothetical protein